jgi:diguanylate cyclase (GGDEF)-like protein
MLILALWTLAVLAGLLWRRWPTLLLSAAAVIFWWLGSPSWLRHPVGWVQLIVLGATPAWLFVLRARVDKRLKRLLNAEAMHLSRLKSHRHELLELRTATAQRESQIAQITDLYHVTKQTSKALHVDELFRRSLEILPRLLTARGLRLIDVEGDPENPQAFRASRHREKLVMDAPGPLVPFERNILQEIQRSAQPGCAIPDPQHERCPAELSSVAWAPLWGEHRPTGVLMADELPSDQTPTLAIVANQLSLQLARVHFYQAVESMAVTDTLTGLFVRRYFTELAQEELQRSSRHRLSCACLLVDLDHFKQQNDTYGHLTGDVVLREVAELLHRNLREVDLIARFGGEEFIVFLVETNADHAMTIAQRLRGLVELHPIRAYDETLRQTVSMGVAMFPDDGQALQQLIDRADQALYAAKRAGRNRVVRWSP